MKISGNLNIHRILSTYQKYNKPSAESVQRAGHKKDKIEISEKARDFQVALNAYQNLPDIRESKVKELSKQIREGKYSPTAEQIAEKMLNRKI